MKGNIKRGEMEEPNEDKVRCRLDSDPNVDAVRFCTRGCVDGYVEMRWHLHLDKRVTNSNGSAGLPVKV